jgi:hypothetical protein
MDKKKYSEELANQICYSGKLDSRISYDEIQKILEEALERYLYSTPILGDIGVNQLIDMFSSLNEVLKSDSVNTVVKFGVENPNVSGLAKCEDRGIFVLQHLVKNLNK